MKNHYLLFVLIAISTAASARTLTVGQPEPRCPNPQYPTIQAAVLAASPGDTINVCPGVYREQVVVNKPLTITGPSPNPGQDLSDPDDAVIMPTGGGANSADQVGPIIAIVLVQNTKNVELTNLTIDGANSVQGSCSPTVVGIYYQNASGEIDHDTVRNINSAPGVAGCQSGLGIYVKTAQGLSSNVEIDNNSVHDYQKNGITANDAGTNANIHDNIVTGLGVEMNNAQNGIQLKDGSGQIRSNVVTNHLYGQCTATSCPFVATNVLVISNNINVAQNTTGTSNVDIYLYGNSNAALQNTAFNAVAFDDIDLVGDRNSAIGNTLFHSDESAVFVQGNSNHVNANTINETPVGVEIYPPSSNTDLNGNRYYNTHVPVSTGVTTSAAPISGPVTTSARQVSPYR